MDERQQCATCGRWYSTLEDGSLEPITPEVEIGGPRHQSGPCEECGAGFE